MSKFRVLVVDDELAFCQLLSQVIRDAGYDVSTAANGVDAMRILASGEIDVVLCDICLPDTDGIKLLSQVRAAGIATIFIMCTSFASVDTAVKALKAGAADYIVKPVSNDEIIHRLRQIEGVHNLRAENRALREIVSGRDDDSYGFISPAMLKVERLVDKVAATDSIVLINGETGTGKGVIARLIHRRNAHRDGPFIPVNCSAIPQQLLESEFFGHTKGAFTGADKARKGLFLAANRGTLFLDEVGELPLDLQPKLLHAIEEKRVRAVGSEHALDVDVRIIVATNLDLAEQVKRGEFRADLFFRLSMFQIRIPPLRERTEDIPGMVKFFLKRCARKGAKETEFTIDPVAENILTSYPWPGNIRELENVISRACIMANTDRITVADLPPELVVDRSDGPGRSASDRPLSPDHGLREKLRRLEGKIIFDALHSSGGDRKAAADLLGIHVSSLYRKLEECAEFGLLNPEQTEAGFFAS